MRRSTWDSASADPGFSCSTLVLEGANIFSAPHDSSRPKGKEWNTAELQLKGTACRLPLTLRLLLVARRAASALTQAQFGSWPAGDRVQAEQHLQKASIKPSW